MVTPQTNSHPTINIAEWAIERAVLEITSVTSEKFVAAPNKTTVLGDLLIGLKRFRNVVRWKAFFQEKADEQSNSKSRTEENSTIANENNSTITSISREGLNTNLKAKNKSSNAPIASKQVEAFLKDIETTLIKQANNYFEMKDIEDKKNKVTTKSSRIKDLTDILSKSSKVVVPTDKTNSFITIEMEQYKEWVIAHLDKAAVRSSTERIKDIFESANELLLGMEELFDKNEYEFIKETIDSNAIPTPKLLIKDHKNVIKKETFQQD